MNADGFRRQIAGKVADWRRHLGYDEGADRAALARLRRIGLADDGAYETVDVGAAFTVGTYRALRIRIAGAVDAEAQAPPRWRLASSRDRGDSGFDERVAVVASVLAHVRQDIHGSLGKALRGGKDEASALYSDLRFRRLMRLRSAADLMREGRRIVRILGGEVPVADLAQALLFFDSKETRRLAKDYYATFDARPEEEIGAANKADKTV